MQYKRLPMQVMLPTLVSLLLSMGCTQMNSETSPANAFKKFQTDLESIAPTGRQEYAKLCMEFAETHDNEQVGVDALLWITRCNRRSIGFQQANDQAIERLIGKHIDRPETAKAIFEMRDARSPKTIQNLRTLLASEDNTIRGLASFSLAHRLKGTDDKSEAISLLENVIEHHAGLVAAKGSRQVSLRRLAEQCLSEIRKLQIGMLAPVTTGIDLEGDPLNLADHRGKVVLISFWADW